MKLPYVIFEVANVHGGSRERLLSLVAEYSRIAYPRKAIKFQPLKADQLALPDYKWYATYEELHLGPEAWEEVIAAASVAGDVWIDIFDGYGVEILKANTSRIAGVKLQASVLDNVELQDALSDLDMSHWRLMINVSGHELSAVQSYVQDFQRLGPSEIVLQIGFQSYPTAVSDTALQKIPVLLDALPGIQLCIADHAPAESAIARQIPAWAVIAGCTYVEKHFCASRAEAKYDHFSALEPNEFVEMLTNVTEAVAASDGPFISESEALYLQGSYQFPVARSELYEGTLVSRSDLRFRRTNQPGLTWAEVASEQSSFSVLAATVSQDSTISKGAFRKAKVGTIVACRMKSSRLKKKATVPIHGIPSVERCLANCLKNPGDVVILATSTLEEDQELSGHTLGGRIKFVAGDPDDVIQRYLAASEEFGIDVVVRVTADCPAVSPEITAVLLEEHFRSGADYTAPASCAVGSSGEIYNVEALRRVIALLGKADHSEYMTWYMQNNPDVFKVNLVELPPSLNRSYRMTLDYPEDLEMFNRLYAALEARDMEPTLPNVFSVLDGEPSIPAINQGLTLTYKTDSALIEKLNRVTRIPAAR